MASRTCRTAASSALALVLLLAASPGPGGPAPSQDKETVGAKAGGRTVVPVNQVVTPHGTTPTLPGMRPQALAISPDGALLEVAGKTPELVIMDPVTLEILQEVPLPAEEQEEQHPETVSPSAVGTTFGAAGSLVLLLLWIYYSAQILFFGAEFTQVYANTLGSRIVPEGQPAAAVQQPEKSPESKAPVVSPGLAVPSSHRAPGRLSP